MAKDYQYYFSQLRRIEDHREAQAEKEIRKIYRDILKETRHFIADEYAALAEDGRLTYEILRSKGQDARFLQEVEQRLGDMSIDVSRQIKKTVEEMYQLSFDGLREAVEKSSDVAEFREIFAGVDRSKAQQLWATVDNTIMDIALEKNHRNIIWDIKREIATALTVGDRFDTMADRLAKSLDGNYKKATLIARTEVHRVREAAHSASAKELNETLKQGGSGLRYVKKWKTMKDGAVRPNVRYKTKKGWKSGKIRPGAPNHVKMHNVVVLEEEMFDLGGGVKTDAPGQSGVAGHDCNCRCQCLHLLMDDEEFFQATGRHFPDEAANMSRKHTYTGSTWPKEGTPITDEELQRLQEYASSHGVRLQSFENFDGDPVLVQEMIDGISAVSGNFSALGFGQKPVILHNSYTMDDTDFAMTKGRNIYINNYAFRDKLALQKEYAEKVMEGWFVNGTDYTAIAYHEMGHVLTTATQAAYSKLWGKAFPSKNVEEILVEIKKEISEYATANQLETIAEAFTAYSCQKNPSKLALHILEVCGIL